MPKPMSVLLIAPFKEQLMQIQQSCNAVISEHRNKEESLYAGKIMNEAFGMIRAAVASNYRLVRVLTAEEQKNEDI